jgi:hypothetical protein
MKRKIEDHFQMGKRWDVGKQNEEEQVNGD